MMFSTILSGNIVAWWLLAPDGRYLWGNSGIPISRSPGTVEETTSRSTWFLHWDLFCGCKFMAKSPGDWNVNWKCITHVQNAEYPGHFWLPHVFLFRIDLDPDTKPAPPKFRASDWRWPEAPIHSRNSRDQNARDSERLSMGGTSRELMVVQCFNSWSSVSI
jgi:hypothetical protein